MTFLNPAALLLLIFVPTGIAFWVWRERIRAARLSVLGDIELVSALFPQISPRRRQWKFALWLVALAASIIALARPVWGLNLDVVETQGVSVMVVLDVSASMDAQDIAPSRIGRAKLAIRDLFDGLAGNELGLIVFAGVAYVQFPLTTDSNSAVTFLNAVSIDSISQQGTVIADALRLAADSFGEQSASARMIVLLTDGENHEGDPLGEADVIAQEGITVDAIGYGDPAGSVIPEFDQNGNITGYKTDQEGEVVESRLDEDTLRSIADRTGGIYQRASASGAEIANLIERIQALETGDLGSRTETRGVERFGIFVALAVLAITLEMMLPETRIET